MRNYTPFIIGSVVLLFIIVVSKAMLSGTKESKASQVATAPPMSLTITSPAELRQYPEQPSNAITVPLILPVPKSISFCGETADLSDPDIRERFEKELYITAHRYYQVIFYLKRIPRVFPEIQKILQQEGMHPDWAYLALIESDLIPTIRSPKGALGIWQFMPETARRHKLRVDRNVDERMHLHKSTLAAIDYLKLAKRDLGSWTLAAAAYNMGLARTKRTVEEQRTTDYYKLHMNPETSRYIFRILAAKAILEQPQLFGYSIPADEIYQRERTKSISVQHGIENIAEWAQRQGTTYYDLKRLNPWLISNTLPGGRYTLEVPI